MNNTGNSEKILAALGDIKPPTALLQFFDREDPAVFYRINLMRLGRELNLPAQELLTIFLKLTDAGLFNLAWEMHCPTCNAIPDFKHHFSEVKSEGFCGPCDLGFRNTLDKNVEVTFSSHPTFFEIPAAIPEAFKQEMLAAIKEKRYKMPEEYVSGLMCLSNETFHELFGDDVLSTQESLAVETVTFFFTDIKGSTQMYSDLGDTRSYEIVREHFKILFAAIARHNGTVVKTIGDAVMGSFLKPVDALQAAIDVHGEFAKREWSEAGYLKIKMGIHTGSAIVVNMNNSVDYFGNTVNLAARVQASVEDHDVRFTKRVLDDSGVQGFLKARHARLRHSAAQFKGINGLVDVYTLTPNAA